MSVPDEGMLAWIHTKACAPSTPARIRKALARLLEQAAHVRADDVEMTVAHVRRFEAGDGGAEDVEAAVYVALFFAGWDRRFP